MKIVIIVVVLLGLLYLVKDRLIMLLFNFQKSKFIFISSYISKVSKASLVNDEQSIFAAIYLNKILLDAISEEKLKSDYAHFFRSDLSSYYSLQLVEKLEEDYDYSLSLFDFVQKYSNVLEIPFHEGGELKIKRAEFVMAEIAKESHLFRLPLASISTLLMDAISLHKSKI